MKTQLTRRNFLQSMAALGGALVASPGLHSNNAHAEASKGSDGLPITISAYKFPRVAALADGRVQVKGCNATFEPGAIGDMNTHIFDGPKTREVSEVGLHPFMIAYANQDFRDYTLLPIFLLRVFRHKSIFIRTDRGIKRPEDLKGKSIATPGYSSTSLTWIRGILQHEYGVSPTDVKWVSASKDSSAGESGKASEQENLLPDGISITPGPKGKDESDLLESGDVDALFHAAQPRAFIKGHPKVARLFPDSRQVERDYYKRTGIFPIMHAVAIRRDTLKKYPWIAKALFDAFSEAKSLAYQQMSRIGWASDALPWYGQELEETQALMGKNFYSYGIKPNKKSLEALFQYSHEQGLTKRRLTIEELFAPEGLELVESIA